MTTTNVTSTKPYLLRAVFEWAEDNALTPQVLVNAYADSVEVPQEHVVDGQIVLNISTSAVQLHVMDNDCISFSARFSGIEQDVYLPMESILAIFARENSQGSIFFGDMDDDDLDPDPEPTAVVSVDKKPGKNKEAKTKSKPKRDSGHLKVVK